MQKVGAHKRGFGTLLRHKHKIKIVVYLNLLCLHVRCLLFACLRALLAFLVPSVAAYLLLLSACLCSLAFGYNVGVDTRDVIWREQLESTAAALCVRCSCGLGISSCIIVFNKSN